MGIEFWGSGMGIGDRTFKGIEGIKFHHLRPEGLGLRVRLGLRAHWHLRVVSLRTLQTCRHGGHCVLASQLPGRLHISSSRRADSTRLGLRDGLENLSSSGGREFRVNFRGSAGPRAAAVPGYWAAAGGTGLRGT